jgi:tRNA(Ile2) C34 agmatinyltransferase TiaS
MVDAEGYEDGPPCPECGREPTHRFAYVEGFDDFECPACGWRSDEAELADLGRDAGDLLERDRQTPRPPVGRPLRA